MKFGAILSAALCALPTAVFALNSKVQVTWDDVYDDKSASLDIVACSNGPNGLETKGFTTLGSLPNFPYIGGGSVVAGWNSPNCGTCFSLAYNGVTIKVLVVDHAKTGFNIAREAMDKLTGGHAVEFGVVNATFSQQDIAECGF